MSEGSFNEKPLTPRVVVSGQIIDPTVDEFSILRAGQDPPVCMTGRKYLSSILIYIALYRR